MKAALLLLIFFPSIAAAAQPPKTIIRGRKMEVLGKGEETSFTGGVTMTRGLDFMSADRMVSREREGFTRAWGHVYMKRPVPSKGLLWQAWGKEGAYDSKASSGTLAGAVYVEVRESTPSARVTRIWADRIFYDQAAGTVTFIGAYPADGPRAREMPPALPAAAPGPRALQREEGGTRDLRGERLTYFEALRRMRAEGGVRVFWEGKKDVAR